MLLADRPLRLDELKRRYLPNLAGGEAIGGFGLTEPGSGSDAGAMCTSATRDGDGWVLNGEKAWITNAGEGETFVVLARTTPGAGTRGISAFVVPSDAPGFAVGTPEEKLGLKASRTAPLYFTDCRVPALNLLGGRGRASVSRWRHSTIPASASPPSRWASTAAPSSWRSTMPANGPSSASRSPATRRSSSRSPICRPS